MSKTKKQKLPKDFASLLEKGSFVELTALFGTYDVNARGGYSAASALAYSECPDDLTRWLVEHGADLHAEDEYGATPLHARARHWRGGTRVLLELGADPNRGENQPGTPLHSAADSFKPESAKELLAFGARVDALNREGRTPLASGLQRCRPADITNMTALAELLLAAGAAKTQLMQDEVKRIGAEFEFVRSRFNPDSVNETSVSLDALYRLFDVTPEPRRVMHDGKTAITVPEGRWEDQHQALWELLVPADGAAETVQGEVIRTSGRLHNELYHQGGMNWDRDFALMAKAFGAYVAMGVPLPPSRLEALKKLTPQLKKLGDASMLCELAVAWVSTNPVPMALPPPPYRR